MSRLYNIISGPSREDLFDSLRLGDAFKVGFKFRKTKTGESDEIVWEENDLPVQSITKGGHKNYWQIDVGIPRKNWYRIAYDSQNRTGFVIDEMTE